MAQSQFHNIISRISSSINQKTRRSLDLLDIKRSSSIKMTECNSVCLALGPYRNLTTLTASVLFLHPHCQVLNHGGSRVYGHKQVNFLSTFSKEKLDRFIQYAIYMSATGRRGRGGGSIIHSHAFDPQHDMQQRFNKTGGNMVKDHIKSLFWKESLITSQYIRNNHVDLDKILSQDQRLRFILPIRNPLDCAVSNITNGQIRMFDGLDETSPHDKAAEAILDEILWFAEIRQAYPNRFFYYFEHTISKDMLVQLAEFLKLEPLDSWLDSAIEAMTIKSGYNHSRDLINFYNDYINSNFTRFPDISSGLLSFFDSSEKPRATS